MKKFSVFIKRTLLVVLPALLAGSLSVGQLHDIKPVAAEEEVAQSSSEYDVENEMYTIKKTGEHSLELLFAANPKKYKNFRKEHLNELQNAITNILKDIVQTKITELSEVPVEKDTSGVEGQGNEKPHAVIPTGHLEDNTPELVHETSDYISLDTYAQLIANYCDYVEGTDYKDLHQVTNGVVIGYAHFYVVNAIRRNGWEDNASTRADVFNDFCVILANRLFSIFNSSVREVYSQFYAAGESILEPNFVVNLDHVSGMLVLVQDKSQTGSEDLGVRDLFITIGGQTAKDDILDVVRHSTEGQFTNFVDAVSTSVIQSVFSEIDFDNQDLNQLIEDIGIQTLINVAGKAGVEKTRDIISTIPHFDTAEFIAKVTEVTTARDVWSAIHDIHVDGVLIVKEKMFQWDGICELFGHLPPLSELKNYADNQWRHNFHIVLDTAVEEVELDVNFGFKGNCKLLRKVAGILDRHVKITQSGDRFNIEVDVPNVLANMYRYLLESEFLDDDLKHELWDLAFSTVDEAYEHIHQKTIEDLMANAEQVDYKVLAESIISADEIKAFFGISRFVTQERVDKFIDKVFWAINKGSTFDINRVYELVDQFYEIPDDLKDQISKIYEKAQKLLQKIAARNYDAEFIHDYLSGQISEEFNEKVNDKIDYYLENAKVVKYYNRFQRLLEKVYARVPNKYRQKSLMDFYKGDSVWSGQGDATFNIKKLVRKIPKIGSKLADFLSSFFENLPTYINIEAKFTAHDLYRISYHIGDNVKTGALPVDTEATFWANKKTAFVDGEFHDIVGWAEARGQDSYQYLLDMPARDVDAYPIWFTTSAGVSKTYDGLESTIEVTPNIEVAHEYSYVWYKDGYLLTDKTESSITVKNHSDSGTYCCYVDGVKLEDIVVSIDRVSVDMPTQTEQIVWDGLEHDYYTSFGATSEEELLYHGSGDVSATEPGQYHVQLEFNDTDNYAWKSGDGSYSWSIDKKVIHVTQQDILWSEPQEFTYDGTEKSVTLQEDKLPDGVHVNYVGNTGVNAGSYGAKAYIELDDPDHYQLIGLHLVSQTWKINKAVITIPAEMGLLEDSFQYDGNPHTVVLNEQLLPQGITGVTYNGTQTATEVGEYTVSVKYQYDHANYTLQTGYQTNFNWEITPYTIDVSGVTWDYTAPFEFDEQTHEVQVVGLPTGVKVEYSGTTKATNPGTYLAHAKLYAKPGVRLLYKGVYYETVGLDLEWKIAGGTPVPTRSEFYSEETNEAGTSLVWMSLSTGIKGDYTLHAEEVDTSKYDFNNVVQTGYVDVVVCYDINLYNDNGELAHINVDANGNVIDPNFVFTVRILVPDSYKEVDLVLCFVNESGQVVRMEGERSGNYMVFTTNHLSIYGLVETHVAGSNITPYVIVSAAALLATQATASWILIMLAKRKRRTVKD